MTTAPILVSPMPQTDPAAYAVPQPGRHLRLVPAPQLSIDDIDAHPLADSRRRDGVEEHARAYFVATAEILVGRRSAEQLGKLTTLPVLQWLRSLTPQRSASTTQLAPPTVRAVHVCHVRDDVVEATAVIQHGPHVRAMNGRFVQIARRWQCVQLQLV